MIGPDQWNTTLTALASTLISSGAKNVSFFQDGLTDCEDPECCESPVCQKSQLCHTVPQPIDILLRKQPPAMTASFFEQMKFIIEDKGLQSYVQRAGFNERYFEHVQQWVFFSAGYLHVYVFCCTGDQFNESDNNANSILLHFYT